MLTDGVSLSPAPDMLFQLISYLTGGERRQKAKALAAGEDPDGDAATLDVLAALEKFPGIRPDPEAFIEALDPLQPRLYSISSSLKINPGRVSLTVDAVRYKIGEPHPARRRLDVPRRAASSRASKIKVYVQKAQHFALPADPAKPIIMIGPGTGVAPFRAFLQERLATKAPGPNWLYFGHQRSDYDFFYGEELAGIGAGHAHPPHARLVARRRRRRSTCSTACARTAATLGLAQPRRAHLRVRRRLRMAKDVETRSGRHRGAARHAAPEDAARYVAELKKNDVQVDVY